VLPAATSLHHLIEAVHGVRPDRPVVRVDDVAFTRWVVAAPAQTLELSLQAIGSDQYRALLGRAVRADISLADDYPTGPVEWSEALVSERPPKVPVAEMYGGTKLFHGPNFQGVAEVLAEGDRHIRARLRCLDAPGSLLDAAFQLVGNWLDSTHSSRTVMYPVAIANVSFFGPHPSPGALLECTARIASVDDQHVSADLQLSRAGVAWAVLRGTRFRRFDSNPRSRAMETHPAKNAASIRQPEGWVLLEDCWPDWHSAGFIANLILGQDGYEEYRKKPPALRRQWLLGRCAAKDAVRYEAWATGITEIFPIEVQVYNDETGRPHVKGWPGRPFLDCDVSISHTGPFAVALARPGESSGPDSVGVGIDIALIAEHPPATLRLALTKAEDQLLNELSLGDPQGRIEWFTRFWAAKESVAKAMGTGLRGNPRQFVVSEVSPAFLTVKARARVFTVGYRTIEDSEQSSRFVVAWTYGEKHEKQPRDDRAAGAQSQPDSPAEEGML
jgi:phosphopantetheinyl transferase